VHAEDLGFWLCGFISLPRRRSVAGRSETPQALHVGKFAIQGNETEILPNEDSKTRFHRDGHSLTGEKPRPWNCIQLNPWSTSHYRNLAPKLSQVGMEYQRLKLSPGKASPGFETRNGPLRLSSLGPPFKHRTSLKSSRTWVRKASAFTTGPGSSCAVPSGTLLLFGAISSHGIGAGQPSSRDLGIARLMAPF